MHFFCCKNYHFLNTYLGMKNKYYVAKNICATKILLEPTCREYFGRLYYSYNEYEQMQKMKYEKFFLCHKCHTFYLFYVKEFGRKATFLLLYSPLLGNFVHILFSRYVILKKVFLSKQTHFSCLVSR